MSYVWFNSVLEFLGKRIQFESISNLYGNAFAKDAAKAIQSANPLVKNGHVGGNGAQTLLTMGGKMTIIDSADRTAQLKQASKTMGDMSWIEEYLKE